MSNRPLLEMADIVRCAGQTFVEHSRRWINWQHQKVLLAIARCRTAALGGHRDRCTGCGHTTKISYNSCRNRHCPRCQGNARLRWLKARARELLPTRYVHAVFTLPRELAPLALQNKRLIYNLLFHASAETLLEVARGINACSFIRMSIASLPPAVSHRITHDGSPHGDPSFCLSACSVVSSAASSSKDFATPSIAVRFSFTASFCR